METWLDLHMHTKYSMDGEFEPADLMRQCADAGLQAAAVTDHDAVGALDEAKAAASALQLSFIPGIEISCQHKGKNFHLLGYGIRYQAPVFAELEQDLHAQRLAISEKVLDAVEGLGIYLDRQAIWDMASSGVVASVNIAKTALEDPHNDGNPLLAPYRPRSQQCAVCQFRLGFLRPGRAGLRSYGPHAVLQSRPHHTGTRRRCRAGPSGSEYEAKSGHNGRLNRSRHRRYRSVLQLSRRRYGGFLCSYR